MTATVLDCAWIDVYEWHLHLLDATLSSVGYTLYHTFHAYDSRVVREYLHHRNWSSPRNSRTL